MVWHIVQRFKIVQAVHLAIINIVFVPINERKLFLINQTRIHPDLRFL